MTEKTYTAKELSDILERQRLILALDHAIQRGKMAGDSPDFINPLVNMYNLVVAPQAEHTLKEEEKPGGEE